MPYKSLEKKLEYNRIYFLEYRKNNREELNRKKREWRKNNIEHAKKREATYAKKYRAANPEKLRAWDKREKIKARARFKIALRQLREEMGGKCIHCGYAEVIDILQFHHLSGKDKEVTRYHSIKKARIEAKKCILLCPNCHAIVTLKEIRA